MSILIVVVRYKTPLQESATIASLSQAFRDYPDLLEAYRVLVWDNGPEFVANTDLPFPYDYECTEENVGVSGAYNRAMERAEAQGDRWMLLLDQDTSLSSETLFTMHGHSLALLAREDIVAIAPTVLVGNIIISPKQRLYLRFKKYRGLECGVASGEAVAINSGCMVRVEGLRRIGGFSSRFWLDYSDIYVFHLFFKQGFKVWRATDATIEHKLSILDYDNLMTPSRYKNFSTAETAFNDLYRGRLENALQTLRLFVRAIKQRFKYENPEFSRIAWKQWLYRITTSRRQRLADWQANSLVRK
jgi:GT2 family glycosyltransferase